MKQWVNEFIDKLAVDSWYLVKDKHLGLGKNGKAFLAIIVGDKTGNIDARIWDRVDEVSSQFEIGDVVQIKGAIQVYQNRKQLVVHRLERIQPEVFPAEDLLPASKVNAQDLFVELHNIIKSVENEHIRQLLLGTIEDPEIKPLILKAPAAKSIHHAWEGGLLEHVVSILKVMNFIASHYQSLNRDLLIFGAIYHDIGKIWELSFDKNIGYTDRGRLIGHLYMGAELVEKKAAKILGFPEELKDILKHIVLSHHGKLEYGSPKRPKFLEALVVAMIDDLDSKISTVQTILENERVNSVDKWSRYVDLFDRYFLLENLKTKY
ncbi:MAG: CRISPR-associated endonuclease Cas3'' [Bdellovibrionia bacterium]